MFWSSIFSTPSIVSGSLSLKEIQFDLPGSFAVFRESRGFATWSVDLNPPGLPDYVTDWVELLPQFAQLGFEGEKFLKQPAIVQSQFRTPPLV